MQFLYKTPKHRVFNYQPLYYDERKERLDNMKKEAEAEAAQKKEYVPGANIRGKIKSNVFEYKEDNGRSRWMSMVIRVLVVLTIALVLYMLIKFSGLMGILLMS